MPGFDQTGPMGAGPMTGGGRGRCRPAGTAGRRYGGRGFGRGLGCRRGFGGGYGYGRGFGYAADRMPNEPPLDILKSDKAYLEKELAAVDSRIAELEKTSPAA